MNLPRSFLAGSLPLSFSLSQSRLRMISTIGMGVLVGTSLIVIIPEGVETLYSSAENTHIRTRRTDDIPSLGLRWDQGNNHVAEDRMRLGQSSNWRREPDDVDPFNAMPGPVIPFQDDPNVITKPDPDPPRTPTAPGEVSALEDNPPHPNITPDKPAPIPHANRSPHAWVGISLILGFILMYLVDNLPLLVSARPSTPSQNIYSLSDLATTASTSSDILVSSRQAQSRALPTTIGLVIHAAADGIALGASSTTPSLSFVIFLAIMIHKAPAAFGLTSVLLKQGLGKRAARAHLIIFSLAAPVGALGTWLIVRLLGGSAVDARIGGEETMRWWTGVLLLFSGGSFL